MFSSGDALVQRLVRMCELRNGVPDGTGPYFWSNVVRTILEALTVPTAVHDETLVKQLAQIEWQAECEHLGIEKVSTFDDMSANVRDAELAGVRAILSALAPLLAARAAAMVNLPSIEDFAEALDLVATALPYDKRRKYNFDERFGRLTAKLELLRPGTVVGTSVVDQALGAATTTKDAVETPKRATLMDRFHDATGTKDSDDYRIMSLGDIRELIKLLDT